jgi:eukaryotic-like serine/threonine-protein kinase
MSTPRATEGNDPERTRLDGRGSRKELVLERGTVLAGKYRLELLLGEGGMGFVWSAYHLELQLPVAIKLLRSGPQSPRLAERLRREARAAAQLVHPSIVRVFDIGVTDIGDPFIVMELLTGETLAQLLAQGRLTGVKAVQLLLPVAEALALAHTRGVVHRDLKPGNVFLSSDGEQLQPKLLDFGIAKLEHAPAVLAKLTDKGMVLGSPSYMSPEQVRGDEVDYRSDIWSFCVVLYKAVTGATPFHGPDPCAIMNAIEGERPAPLACVDEQLARLIQWGLNKDPTLRPMSMRELGRELAQWLVAQGVSEDVCGTPVATKWLAHVAPPSQRPVLPQPEARPERTVPIRRRHWALLTAAAMLVVSGGVAHTDSFRNPPAAASSAPLEVPAAPPIPTTAIVLAASPPAPPPDLRPSEQPPLDSQSSVAPTTRANQPGAATRPRPVPTSRLPF